MKAPDLKCHFECREIHASPCHVVVLCVSLQAKLATLMEADDE